MSEKTKREETAADRWNRAVREAYTETPGADDQDELSDEEIKRQLVAAGVDLAAEDAKADATYPAMIAKLEADERRREAADEADAPASTVAWVAPTNLRPAARPRRSRPLWVAYAIAAAAAVGSVAYAVGHRTHEPPEPPPHDPPIVKPVETAPVPTVAPPETPPQPDKSDKKAPR